MAEIFQIEQVEQLEQTTRQGVGFSSATSSTCNFRAARVFDQCEIIDELGRGGGGIVFLARQPHLGNRLVVLKFIPRSESEHLSLARLQHANIVPLFDVYDCDPQEQRALCMPFVGSATLSHVLSELYETPPAERHGRDIIACLDRARTRYSPANSQDGPARQFLLGADYPRAICWLGANLADGLQYAHERGLIHLDVKPSNILFATDGTPMLLDFHLARAPVQVGEYLAFLGGTARYMAPEQLRATADVAANRPVGAAVGARADIFALGVVLYETLAGEPPYTPGLPFRRLEELNPRVSTGLADIVHRALAVRCSERYGTAGELARDLRLHLESKPLVGVANRNVAERWQKWRKRRPLRIALVSLVMMFVSGLLASGIVSWRDAAERRQTAAQLHIAGARQFEQKYYAQATQTLAEAFELTQTFAGDRLLGDKLTALRQLCARAEKADALHKFTDRLRLHAVTGSVDQRGLVVLDVGCRDFWQRRSGFLDEPQQRLDPAVELQVRRDLVELAIAWAEVRLQLHVRETIDARRAQALAILRNAEQIVGPSAPLLYAERRLANQQPDNFSSGNDAWAHGVLGRLLLQDDQLEQAAHTLETALRTQPDDYWSNFCYGICSARQQSHQKAVQALSICIRHQPNNDAGYVQRGKSYAAMQRWELAAQDYQRALRIRPNIAAIMQELTRIREEAKR